VVTGSPSGNNEFGDVQSAVDAAEAGAVIGIDEAFSPSPDSQINVDVEDVTVTGFNGKPTVDLTGASPSGNSAGAVQVSASGVTLQNFNIDYEADANGIEANNAGLSDITVDGMRVKNTAAPSSKPAINLEKAESVRVTNNEARGAAIGAFFTTSNQNTSTISNNYVDLNPGNDSPATGGPTEGIFAYGPGASNTDFEIRNNEVVDKPTGEEGIKILQSPSSINGESGTGAQLESLLRENDISEADVSDELGTKSSGFSDIQSAVNAASRLTIVESGTFDESVSISSDGFTLKGPNAGVAYDGSRGDEATISAPAGERAVDISGDGVKVNGIRAEGQNDGVVAVSDGADGQSTKILNSIIRADSTTGTNAVSSSLTSGVLVTNNRTAPDVSVEGNDIESGEGATVNGFSGSTNGSVTVSNNEIRGDPGGLRDIEDLTVENNDIFPLGSPSDKALDVSGVTNSATIRNNTFTGDPDERAYNDDDDSDVSGTDESTVLNDNNFVPGGTTSSGEVQFN
jgi:hypothetical protein